jgi:hypothetical protein
MMSIGILIFLSSGIFLLIPTCMGYINIPLVLIGVSIAMVGITVMGSTAMSMALSPFHTSRGSAGALFSSFQLFLSFGMSALVAALPYSGTSILASTYFFLGLLALVLNRRLIT